MDPMDFFIGSKPLIRKTLLKPARKQYKLSTDVSSIYCESETSTLSTCGGTEYVDEYLEKEDAELKKSSQFYRSVPSTSGTNFDQVSLNTTVPSTAVFDDDLERIYKTFDLRYVAKSNLAISLFKDKIVSMIETNPVTIIQGPTGCGKTTQVPQFILDSCYHKRAPCNIIVTQPRRIAAMSIAKRVSDERGWPVGSLVGFRVGLINYTGADTRLTYCTTGVLLQRLVQAKQMNDYTHVIIDEVHERDQDMDFLLLVVRKFLRSNSRSVRVILMSATFNVDKFSKYFSFYAGTKLIQGPIIDVTKSNFFQIREYYLNEIVGIGEIPEVEAGEPDISKEMMRFATTLMIVMDNIDKQSDRFGCSLNDDRPTILVFLPGIHEIEELYALLMAPNNENMKWDVVVLHSSITSDEQQKIFDEPPPTFRRIILSTNIAESSITVPNVKYVIDFCLTKQLVTDPATNFHTLELTWASKANCQQRAGRTGRVMDGRVYRLVPKGFYEDVLPNENPPEIVRAPLENVYLKAKMLNLDKPKALLALSLDPPDLTNLYRTVLNLKESGALLDIDNDLFDGELTDLGKVMAQLPMDIHISKLIALGHVFSVFREAIIIGASMSVKNVFSAPFQQKLQAYDAKLLWSQNTNSDGIAFLNAYKGWMNFRTNNSRAKSKVNEKSWARRSFLQIKVLREIEATIIDVTKRLESLGITETRGQSKVQWTEEERQFVLKIVIAGAFYPQYYTAEPKTDDRACVKELGGLDPAKTVYLVGWPIKQPGMLYAKRIQEIFQEVLNSETSRIGVKFDHSNRVYIQFNKTEVEDKNRDIADMPGEIPLSVYRALKMRGLGREIAVPVMNADLSIKKADELGVERAPQNIYLPREKKRVDRHHAEIRPILPSLDTTGLIPIWVQRIVDPGHFWVTRRNPDHSSKAKIIKDFIHSMDQNQFAEFTMNPKIGTLVLAPREVAPATETEDKKFIYERAIVQSVFMLSKDEYGIQAFFIDNGKVSKLRVSDIRQVPEDCVLRKIPALAFQCVLSHIKPAILNTLTGQWSKAAKGAFINVLKGRQVYAEVYSVVNSVASINLYAGEEKGEKLHVNDHLVREGFAECREEDYLSRYNHGIREDFKKLSPEEIHNHEDLQHSQLFLADSYVDPPGEDECSSRVILNGPFSPLEVKLSNLIGAGVGLKIGIDPVSVNSVLLDSTRSDPQERLVVAGSVSQGAHNSHLTLRNTTLMPNIPGLTSLLGLIFAPKVELRANYLRTRNVGALCGLGYDQTTRRSLFPEHDMTLNFDVDITVDDLQNINRLRYWMSLGIYVCSEDDADKDKLAEDAMRVQIKVKEILFDLIDKKRDPNVPEVDLRNGKWCRYDESIFIEPAEVNVFKNLIFKLHRALDIQQKDDAKEFMLTHLEELRKTASMKLKETQFADIDCRLCDQKLSGILQLRTHLGSPYHCTREEQFKRNNQV